MSKKRSRSHAEPLQLRLTPVYDDSGEASTDGLILGLPVSLGRVNLAECWWQHCPRSECQARCHRRKVCARCALVRRRTHLQALSRAMVDIDSQGDVNVVAKHAELVHCRELDSDRASPTRELCIGPTADVPWMRFRLETFLAPSTPHQWVSARARERSCRASAARKRIMMSIESLSSEESDSSSARPTKRCLFDERGDETGPQKNQAKSHGDVTGQHTVVNSQTVTPLRGRANPDRSSTESSPVSSQNKALQVQTQAMDSKLDHGGGLASIVTMVTPGKVTESVATATAATATRAALFTNDQLQQELNRSSSVKKTRQHCRKHLLYTQSSDEREIAAQRTRGPEQQPSAASHQAGTEPHGQLTSSSSFLSMPLAQSSQLSMSPLIMKEATQPVLRRQPPQPAMPTLRRCVDLTLDDWKQEQLRSPPGSFRRVVIDSILEKNEGNSTVIWLPAIISDTTALKP